MTSVPLWSRIGQLALWLLSPALALVLATALAAPAGAARSASRPEAPTTAHTGKAPDSAAVQRAERAVRRAWQALATCRRTAAGPARTRCVKKARARIATAQRALRAARARQKRDRIAARARCWAQGRVWVPARCLPLPTNPPRVSGVTALGGGTAGPAPYTWPAYRAALASGVSRLQAPVQVSADHVAWVHPTARVGAGCQNGAPASPGDPQYPYLGTLVRDLSTAQLETLECGTLGAATTDAAGSRMLRVDQLLRHASALSSSVGFDLEIDHDPTRPADTWPVATLVSDVSAAVSGRVAPARVAVLGADWSVPVTAASDPVLSGGERIGIDLGTNLARGRAGGSAWLAGEDIDAQDVGAVGVATSLGLTGLSTASWVDGKRYLTRGQVWRGRRAGLTMDGRAGTEPFTLRNLVLSGVDRVLTARPDRAPAAWTGVGEPLPSPVPVPVAPVTALPRAHAHNDYVHPRPLLDALDLGFSSVEADVYLIDGELRVGHSVAETSPGRTLQRLYLEPLAARVENGTVLDRGVPFHLLAEVKVPEPAEVRDNPALRFATATETWQAIEAALAAPAGLVTQYEPYLTAPVQVTMTGSRPKAAILATAPRHAGVDGDIADAAPDSGYTPAQITLISEGDYFGWDARAPMTTAEQTTLFGRVRTAHAGGFRFRWYGIGLTSTPTSRVAMWAGLYDLGYDYLNIDDLALGATFFRNRDLT